MGPLVGWDRDRQGQSGGKGLVGVDVLCVLCVLGRNGGQAVGRGGGLVCQEGVWCVRRGHSAHPGVGMGSGWGQCDTLETEVWGWVARP